MKLVWLLCLLLLANIVNAQRLTRYSTYSTGLIYHDTTITQLRHGFDALHRKFKPNKSKRTFRSVPQALARYVEVTGADASRAAAFLAENPSFEAFLEAFKPKYASNPLMVAQFQDASNENIIYRGIVFGSSEIDIRKPMKNGPIMLAQRWVVSSEWTILRAFFFLEAFHIDPIPSEYASMIQYVDCLVDTNHSIFLGSKSHRATETMKPDYLFDYIYKEIGRDNIDKYYNHNSNGEYTDKWWEKIDSLKNQDQAKFMSLLRETLEGVKKGDGYLWSDFDEYVARYLSKKEALEVRRRMVPESPCGTDDRPHYENALYIAQLSAETMNWDIFLRAHLDLMDKQYSPLRNYVGWGYRRDTYVRELEELNINTFNLLLGIVLRASNISKNHYSGSTIHIGRALTDAKNRLDIESQMLDMIANNSLDSYNRMRIFRLYMQYAHSLGDGVKTNTAIARLKDVTDKLPPYLAQTVKLDLDSIETGLGSPTVIKLEEW